MSFSNFPLVFLPKNHLSLHLPFSANTSLRFPSPCPRIYKSDNERSYLQLKPPHCPNSETPNFHNLPQCGQLNSTLI